MRNCVSSVEGEKCSQGRRRPCRYGSGKSGNAESAEEHATYMDGPRALRGSVQCFYGEMWYSSAVARQSWWRGRVLTRSCSPGGGAAAGDAGKELLLCSTCKWLLRDRRRVRASDQSVWYPGRLQLQLLDAKHCVSANAERDPRLSAAARVEGRGVSWCCTGTATGAERNVLFFRKMGGARGIGVRACGLRYWRTTAGVQEEGIRYMDAAEPCTRRRGPRLSKATAVGAPSELDDTDSLSSTPASSQPNCLQPAIQAFPRCRASALAAETY